MEFSRWGLDQFNRISDRYRGFKDFLADVLEGERSLIEPHPENSSNPESVFQVRNDLEKMVTEPMGRVRTIELVKTVFKRLAPYYEAGFLLETSRERVPGEAPTVILESMFLFGRAFTPPSSEAPRVELSFPHFSPLRVYRGRANAVLRVFRLDSLESLKDASVFAFSPRPEVTFVLVCNRPHPWQVTAIEKTFFAVTELLYDPRRISK
jgi:hypothetical protein